MDSTLLSLKFHIYSVLITYILHIFHLNTSYKIHNITKSAYGIPLFCYEFSFFGHVIYCFSHEQYGNKISSHSHIVIIIIRAPSRDTSRYLYINGMGKMVCASLSETRQPDRRQGPEILVPPMTGLQLENSYNNKGQAL